MKQKAPPYPHREEYRAYLRWLLESGEYAAFEEPELPAFSFRGPHHFDVHYKAMQARDAASIRRWLEGYLGVSVALSVDELDAELMMF
jgi:hypothetical protein